MNWQFILKQMKQTLCADGLLHSLSLSLRLKLSCLGKVRRALCGLESSGHYLFMCLHADVELR